MKTARVRWLGPKLMDESVIVLIDRLERHKASVAGQSELIIGKETILSDYVESIQMLNEMRTLLMVRTKRLEEAQNQSVVAEQHS